MQVSVIIPTYNGNYLLSKSLTPLIKSLKNIKSEIVVVDNGSTDETKHFIKTRYPFIKYLHLNKNYGFTRAINEGAKIAKGSYALILNNDCFLEGNTVEELVKTAKEHDYVATQPIVYTMDRDNIENIGYLVDTWFGKARVVTDRNYKLKTHSDRYIYGLSATCLLIQRDIFKKMGMLDETFHSYLEDVDLFIRLNKANYKYGPTLSASCTHEHMGTSAKMGTYKERRDFVNWIRIIIKNFKPVFILKHLPTLFTERLRNFNGIVKKMLP